MVKGIEGVAPTTNNDDSALKDKIKHALDESLILVTGAQILIGFNFQGVFDKGFDNLPELSRYLKIVSLGFLLITLCMVLAPAPFHYIAERSRSTRRFHAFIRKVIVVALLPFAVGLGINFYVATEKILGQTEALILGLGTFLLAAFFWYGLSLVFKPLKVKEKPMKSGDKDKINQPDEVKLAEKIDQVLTETRVVLPGVQALLGFQFASILMEGFDRLSPDLKYIHLISLGMIALSTILLMSPAAFHRIVEKGEDTQRLLNFASFMVLASMVPLALGISGDLFVVVQKVTGLFPLALGSALAALTLFYGFWFGYSLYRRHNPTSSTSA
ncbi:MAG: hypothetical protein JWP00_3998 [Chloroflexi bacterium]|jgi:hypothetical protein|nr:hypothetical protein [Chloroflexota bacterium]